MALQLQLFITVELKIVSEYDQEIPQSHLTVELKIGTLYPRMSNKSVLSIVSKIVSEYDQEIPQSQTADNPVAPQGRAAQPSRDTRKKN